MRGLEPHCTRRASTVSLGVEKASAVRVAAGMVRVGRERGVRVEARKEVEGERGEQ